MSIFNRIAEWLIARAQRRSPDFVIGQGNPLGPYLNRWWLIPRNRFFNVYLHQFLRSDDDRALHDHPWANCSVLLRGCYVEHTIDAGGINRRTFRIAGDVVIRRSGRMAHRVELVDSPCWTVFITGPRYREWGFHCPEQGWVHWQRFTAPTNRGDVGAGCDA
jgi:hypothetical protein